MHREPAASPGGTLVARLRERRWLIPTALVLAGAIVIGVIIARRGPSAPAFVTGPARTALNDSIASGQASVSGAQIALQTALAAAQGVITSDQQDVVTAQAQLNDSKAADAAAINVAAATLRQTQASTQSTINAAQ